MMRLFLNMGLTKHIGVTKRTIERTFVSLQKKGKMSFKNKKV